MGKEGKACYYYQTLFVLQLFLFDLHCGDLLPKSSDFAPNRALSLVNVFDICRIYNKDDGHFLETGDDEYLVGRRRISFDSFGRKHF